METHDLALFNYDTYKAAKLEYVEIVSQRKVYVNVNKKYILYKILIKKRQYEELKRKEYIERRYSDFEALHKQLKEERRDIILPALPAKKMVNLVMIGNYDKLKDRSQALELYLNKLMTNELIWESTILKRFLSSVS